MENQSIYSLVDENKNKTIVVMVLFVLFVSTVFYLIGKTLGYGMGFAGIAILMSFGMSFGSYYFGDKLILGITGAKEADRKRDFDLYTSVENLCIASGIPKPKVYILEDRALNAFATGRDPQNAIVCVTRGLIEILDRREIEGVIAHELSHVKNFDTRLMAIVAVLVGSLAIISDIGVRSFFFGGNRDDDNRSSSGAILFIIGFLLAILSPIIATLIQLAISRRREFLADASGALITRNPSALASALEKIYSDKYPLKSASNATAHLFISNPFKGKANKGIWFSNLFNTHPPIEERIRILRQM